MTVRDYQDQPKDVSHCTVEPCSYCNQSMWLSEKKKGAITLAEGIGKDVWLGCTDCFERAVNNGHFTVNENVIKL